MKRRARYIGWRSRLLFRQTDTHAPDRTRCRPNGCNRTGPPCSVGRPTENASGGRPACRQRYRRRQMTTDASEHNNTGLLGGPVTKHAWRVHFAVGQCQWDHQLELQRFYDCSERLLCSLLQTLFHLQTAKDNELPVILQQQQQLLSLKLWYYD